MSAPGSSETDRARRRGVLWVAAGAALWGTDPVFRRPLTSHLPAPLIVAAEHLILSIVLLPVLWRSRFEWLRLNRGEWAAILGISWGGSALATVLFTESIRTGNPTSAVLLQKLQPLFAALFARLLLRESIGGGFWSHAALALSGAYLVTFGDGRPVRALLPAEWVPAMFALGAAGIWGACTVLGRFVLDRISFAALTALRVLTAMPLLLAFALMAPHPTIQQADVVWLVVLALLPGLAALLIYYRGLGRTRASLAAIAELSFPAVAMLLNWIFLDTRVTVLQAAGFVLLWSVIFHLDRSDSSRRRSWEIAASSRRGTTTI